jgi:hypothetical protein
MPGGMTVPPWFGWADILTFLLVLVVVAVVFVVLGSTTGSRDQRAEFQAYLDARSGMRPHARDGLGQRGDEEQPTAEAAQEAFGERRQRAT